MNTSPLLLIALGQERGRAYQNEIHHLALVRWAARAEANSQTKRGFLAPATERSYREPCVTC